MHTYIQLRIESSDSSARCVSRALVTLIVLRDPLDARDVYFSNASDGRPFDRRHSGIRGRICEEESGEGSRWEGGGRGVEIRLVFSSYVGGNERTRETQVVVS